MPRSHVGRATWATLTTAVVVAIAGMAGGIAIGGVPVVNYPVPPALTVVAPNRPTLINVKRNRIVIPPPAGMMDVLGKDYALDARLQCVVLPTNYLEAAFLPEHAWARASDRMGFDDPDLLTDFATVQSPKKESFSGDDNCDTYIRMRRALSESFKMRIDNMAPWLRTSLALAGETSPDDDADDLDVQLGESYPVSILRSDDDGFSAVVVTRQPDLIHGHKQAWVVVTGMAMVVAHERLIYLYKYKRGAPNQNRVNAVKQSLARWSNAVLAAN
jgi:hypothetical protein